VKNWKQRSLGVLDSLDRNKADAALDFVTQRKGDLLKAALIGWGVFLAMAFTLISAVRLALHFPL